MFKTILNYGSKSFIKGHKDAFEIMLDLLDLQPSAKLVDLGCGGGSYCSKLKERVRTDDICGIEIYAATAKDAHRHGFEVIRTDLNKTFPFTSQSFDVVTANQVIEHIEDTDNFVSEIYRILKLGGYTILATENLSSWDNLFALFMGQQAFSQSISRRYKIGNRFSSHFGQIFDEQNDALMTNCGHKIIFTYYSIQHMLSVYGFKLEKIVGIATFPFPRFLSKIDPVHCRFIIVKARK